MKTTVTPLHRSRLKIFANCCQTFFIFQKFVLFDASPTELFISEVRSFALVHEVLALARHAAEKMAEAKERAHAAAARKAAEQDGDDGKDVKAR